MKTTKNSSNSNSSRSRGTTMAIAGGRRGRRRGQSRGGGGGVVVSSYFMTTILLVVFSCVVVVVNATKHSFHMKEGPSLVGPVGVPFGFLDTGYYELKVYNFDLTEPGKEEEPEVLATLDAGFFLQRYQNEAQFNQHMELLKSNRSMCSFEYFRDREEDAMPFDGLMLEDSFDASFADASSQVKDAKHGILLKLKGIDSNKLPPQNITYNFQPGEAGLYFLIYQVCPYDDKIRSTFDLDFHFMNYDNFGNATYLTAGEMRLPLLFFFFAMSYLVCFIAWVVNNRMINNGLPGLFEKGHGQPIVYPIHHLMSALLLFKFLATFFESIRYHFIRVLGHAELWSVAYYLFTFIKGTFLFIVILLIGTGWSFVKPFLNDREKKVVLVILCLQVANNIALLVLSHLTEGESEYESWTAILHLVDILCCVAVLLPIVWQVNMLEKSIGDDDDDDNIVSEEEVHGLVNGDNNNKDDDGGGVPVDQEEAILEEGEKGQILNKLKLFRSFYLLVVAYIYSTRILVYLFATMLSYKHLWVRYVVVEVITLSFYVIVGMMFRPMAENPYLSVKKYEQHRRARNNTHAVEMTNRVD